MPSNEIKKKIKTEYIRGEASIRVLAEKYGESARTFQTICANEKWAKQKDDYAKKLGKKMVEKALDADCRTMENIAKASDNLIEAILRKSQSFVDECKTPEELTQVTSQIRGLSASLKDLQTTSRMAKGIPTVMEANAIRMSREKMDLEREKFQAEKEKAEGQKIEVEFKLPPAELME